MTGRAAPVTAAAGRMHICLVCHTEPDVWDGGLRSIDEARGPFLDMLNSLRDGQGRAARVAWCLTDQVMRQRAGVFLELGKAGHEVGVHSHYPAGGGMLEHHEALNKDHLEAFADWFPGLCALAVKMGFPRPRVHATWMFAYRDHMTRTLADCGVGIDCSVCYGGAHYLPDGFLLGDSRRRRSGKPYWLSGDDHCLEGSSGVVELPVSGGFGDYWEADGGGAFHFFYPVVSDVDLDRQLRLFRSRLDDLGPGEVDIFHIHFHLYEFHVPGGLSLERIERAGSLLSAMVGDDRARFSTPSEAVADWIGCG